MQDSRLTAQCKQKPKALFDMCDICQKLTQFMQLENTYKGGETDLRLYRDWLKGALSVLLMSSDTILKAVLSPLIF